MEPIQHSVGDFQPSRLEYFAALAMQGLVHGDTRLAAIDEMEVAAKACSLAEALINELEKKNPATYFVPAGSNVTTVELGGV